MPYFRKKSLLVEAVRWYKNGDHPKDDVFRPFEDTGKIPSEPREGAVVRYYRHPSCNGKSICPECDRRMHDHGWIDVGRDGYTVCPGDWIVNEIDNNNGGYYPLKPNQFDRTYEMISTEDK